MDPVTTSTMIGGIVGALSNQLAKDKSVKNFLSQFSEATVNWLSPIFLKEDGSEKESISNLKQKPESLARQKAIESAIEIELENQPETITHIKEIFEQLSKSEESGKIINTIINSKNVNTGNINSGGGDVRIGDSK